MAILVIFDKDKTRFELEIERAEFFGYKIVPNSLRIWPAWAVCMTKSL